MQTHHQRIGTYDILRRLGQGSMGVVYLAREATTGRDVALKQILRAEPTQLLRFKREFRAMKRLSHPSLVRVFDYGEEGGVPFFTMELVEGRNVRAYVWDRPPGDRTLTASRPNRDQLARLVTTAIAFCEPLQYIHEQCVVHRDIKPTNLMVLDGEGSTSPAVKLMDFSLVKEVRVGLQQADLEITQAGTLIGTPAYMSPEQVLGEDVDARSDLYALGVVLYELATGERPFDGTSAFLTALKHLNDPPRDPREVNPLIPESLSEVILRLLAKEPNRRFMTARAVARTLDGVRSELVQSAERSTVLVAAAARGKGRSPAPPAMLYRPGLIGRRAQLDQLQRHVEALKAGRGSFVLLSGVTGVGKTRLLREVRALARQADVAVTSLSCAEEDQRPLGLFNRLFEATATEWPEQRLRRAPDLPRASIEQLLPYCPPLARLLGDGGGPRNLDTPSAQVEQRVFDGLARLLAWLYGARPRCLTLDNLQWADASSLKAIGHLARLAIQRGPRGFEGPTSRLPILVVGALRTDELGEGDPMGALLDELRARQRASVLSLPPLDRVEVLDMVGSMTGTADWPKAFIDRLYRETEGNPFYVEEVLRDLVAEGWLYRLPTGRWTFARPTGDERPVTASDFDRIRMPLSMREAVQRRLALLGPDVQEVLRIAAVLGDEFDFDQLQRVSGLPEDPLLDAVDDLLRHRVFVEIDGRADWYRFARERIREVVYTEIEPQQRADLHRRTADHLVATWNAQRGGAGRVAHHYLKAGDRHAAIPYLLAAAREEADVFADGVALAHLEQAFAIAGDGSAGLAAADRARALCLMGELLTRRGAHGEARERFSQVLELMEGRDPASRRFRVEALLGIADSYWRQGALLVASEFGKEALEAARALGEDDLIARVLESIYRAEFFRGEVDVVETMLTEALELRQRLDDKVGQATCLGALATVAHRRADYQRAIDRYEASCELSRQLDLRARLTTNLSNLTLLYYELGRYGDALRTAAKALELSRELGDRQSLSVVLANEGIVLGQIGLFERALERLETSVAISEELKEGLFLPFTLVIMTRVLRAVGQTDRARETLLRAHRLAEKSENPEDTLDVGLEAARVMSRQGRVELAMRRLEGLLGRARELDHPRLEAAVQHLRGRLMLLQGQWTDGLEAARAARDMRLRYGLAESWSSASLYGEICLMVGRREEALENLERARQLLERSLEGLDETCRRALLNQRGVRHLYELLTEIATEAEKSDE